MIISSGIQYRSFAAQNNFSFYFDIKNSTTSGISDIGFSGDSGIIQLFSLKSGNILDLNNKDVWSYNPRDVINISGNIGSNYINYFINDIPICLFSPKLNNYYYDNFYVQTRNSKIEYNFYIKGFEPEYDFQFPDNVLFGQNITGFIFNKENIIQKSFKIFSGTIFNQNSDYLIQSIPLSTISGNTSGKIVFEANFLNEITILESVPSRINLLLNTNFGQIIYPIDFNLNPAPVYYIELVTGYTGALGLIDNLTYSKYYNYELRTILPENKDVFIFLKNISGHTGEIVYTDFEISGQINGNLSNFVYGFDYLTGIGTGAGISWGNQTDYYGNKPTGYIIENISSFEYATGRLDYIYELPLYGGSGTGYSPPGTIIPAFGALKKPLSGFIYGYGIFSGVQNIDLTGVYFNSQNVTTGDKLLISSGAYTGTYFIDYSKLFWKSDYITGIGFTGSSDKIFNINGERFGNILTTLESGAVDFNRYLYTNQLTGNLLTPILNNDGNLFLFFGSGFASENSALVKNAFTGNNYFYITGNTGEIGFFFRNFTTQNKPPILFYSFDLDSRSLQYPSEFYLQISTDKFNWITIDYKINNNNFNRFDILNLYEYPEQKLIFECNASFLNDNYNYARIFIGKTEKWPHNFIGDKTNIGIGIKNIQFYNKKLISLNNSELYTRYPVVPILTGYVGSSFQSSGFQQSFSGEVIYSNNSFAYPAWYAFNPNKNLYPYAEISGDQDNKLYIGYNTSGNIFDISGFSIEFETGFNPSGVILEASRDNINYNPLYWNYTTQDNLTLDISFTNLRTGYTNFRFRFNEVIESSSSSSIPCVVVPSNIDINSSCYSQVILNDPFCCEIEWDGTCDIAYNICQGTNNQESQNYILWVDSDDTNSINNFSSSSSSS